MLYLQVLCSGQIMMFYHAEFCSKNYKTSEKTPIDLFFPRIEPLHIVLGSQVSSIDTALALGARGCEFESRQYHCFCEN